MSDVAIHWAEGESFPVPVATPGAIADGVVVDVSEAARERLDFYEVGFGYSVVRRTVGTRTGDIQVAMYIPEDDWPIGPHWSLANWQTSHGALTREAAREYIGLIASHAPRDAARTFPQVRMRAASRLRASSDPSPEAVEPFMAHELVMPERTEQPYIDYFAVREDWLAFPKFNGAVSSVVKRASFLGGDAVTVLPYDPSLDSVLLVRQFRHGPFARGDTNPWTLEPAAGRIDPGETPEDTARRELHEETGVSAGELHLIGRYYPTPGAFSEFLFSYVARADLAGVDGGVAGLAAEAEDIMRHVVALDDALSMVESGAINTGPLILSLNWLALHKERLA